MGDVVVMKRPGLVVIRSDGPPRGLSILDPVTHVSPPLYLRRHHYVEDGVQKTSSYFSTVPDPDEDTEGRPHWLDAP